MSLEIHFVLAQEDGKSKKFRLTNDEYVIIGRSKTLCQVYINDPVCSSTHCKVSVVNNGIFVEDLTSKNGLFLNGVKILKQRMYVDDKIRLGNCILFINHSRMDEESVKTATYYGSSREANLTLELDKNKSSNSLKKLGTMFNPPKLSTKRVQIHKSNHTEQISKSQKITASMVDILCALVLFILANVVFWNMYPEAYQNDQNLSFFVIMFRGKAIKFTIAAVIISFMFHSINKRLPTGSVGEKFSGIA